MPRHGNLYAKADFQSHAPTNSGEHGLRPAPPQMAKSQTTIDDEHIKGLAVWLCSIT